MDDGETFDAEDAEKWINLNSFMARLMERNLVHWTNFAIWNFRAALEEPPQPQVVMDCHVSVLGEWISHAGEGLYAKLSDEVSEDAARVTEPGILYSGKAGLSHERWKFWKERLTEIGEVVSEDVKPVAVAAVEKMTEIEAPKQ